MSEEREAEAELEFRQGALAAMLRDYRGAIASFQRSLALAPHAVSTKLNLLASYEASGGAGEAEAEALAADLLRQHPTDGSVLEHVARRRARQGRHDEALALIHSPHVDLGPRGNAYPQYLQILVGAERWEEVALATRAALTADTVWAPTAHLARLLALLHFGEHALARATLAAFDPHANAALIDDWVEAFKTNGTLPGLRALLAAASAALPDEPRLAVLSQRFADSAG